MARELATARRLEDALLGQVLTNWRQGLATWRLTHTCAPAVLIGAREEAWLFDPLHAAGLSAAQCCEMAGVNPEALASQLAREARMVTSGGEGTRALRRVVLAAWGREQPVEALAAQHEILGMCSALCLVRQMPLYWAAKEAQRAAEQIRRCQANGGGASMACWLLTLAVDIAERLRPEPSNRMPNGSRRRPLAVETP